MSITLAPLSLPVVHHIRAENFDFAAPPWLAHFLGTKL